MCLQQQSAILIPFVARVLRGHNFSVADMSDHATALALAGALGAHFTRTFAGACSGNTDRFGRRPQRFIRSVITLC